VWSVEKKKEKTEVAGLLPSLKKDTGTSVKPIRFFPFATFLSFNHCWL
jgi:hypothetical protein